MKTRNQIFLPLCGIYLLLISLTASCKVGKDLTPTNQMKNPYQQEVNTQETSIQKQEELQPIDYEAVKQAYINQHGIPLVALLETSEGLRVTITTPRLVISSVTEEEIPAYAQYLYGSPTVMEKFATGQTKDAAYAKTRIDAWTNRWKNKIPFAGLTIRDRATNEFIGHIVLGGGDEPNSSEVAYMLKEDKWNQGFGYEAVGASVIFYGGKLQEQGYNLPNKELFQYVIATTRQDNIASAKIQQKMGMSLYKSTEKFGHLRDHYSLPIGKFTL